MYVRKKFVRRGEKTYGPYWQVVRATRVDGKVRQRVVAHIGAYDAPREEADIIARMKGILCGVPGCGQAATDELTTVQGYRATRAWKGGEYPYLVCAAHLDAWRSGEEFRVYPLLLG